MTQRFGIIALLGLLSGSGPAGVRSDVTVLLTRAELQENFEHESLGQFASYPPAQDVGYEPSLTPTAVAEAPGGRALMRVVRPTAPGPLQIGFIRKTPLVMSAGATLAFRYHLLAPGSDATIEVGIAGGDGIRYLRRVDGTQGEWNDLELPLSSLAPADGRGTISAGVALEALFLIADLPNADPSVTYRFVIDDIRLKAERPAQFVLLRPQAREVPAGSALTAESGFTIGEMIAIDASAPVPLASVECTLRAPDGREVARGSLSDDGSGGNRDARDRQWTNRQLHRLRASDPRGAWTAVLEGRSSDGRRIATEVRFLVTDRAPQAHPRLFVSAADRERLRARTQHPTMRDLWRRTLDAAAASRASGPIAHADEVFERLDTEYLLPSLLGYFDAMNRARARISNNALVAWVTGDETAFQAARTALLEVSAWSRWEPPWFTAHGQHTYYPAGQLASAVALGYDLLYDRLTEEERARIRTALRERSILPTWREYVADNRVMANTSNWIAHTVGGAVVAAAAIIGDGTPDETRALHMPLNGLLLKIEAHMQASFLRDGSYGEGISYQEFDLETLGPMLHAAERVLGQSYWTRTHVLRSLAFPLHTLATPVSESLDMGDTHPPAGHGIGPVIYRSPDPQVRWYGRRFEPRTIYDFLFFDEDVAPQPPEGHGSRWFAEKGNVVFRTGWEADDAVLLFRAGPTFNHNHNDQGSFLLRNFGETLATEAGWSDYYKDPHYGSFFTQAIGHNTLLVDGHPESQVIADTPQFDALNRYPRISDIMTSRFYDAVGSRLEAVYPQLISYTRRLTFLKPDVLVVFDRVKARRPSCYDVLLHIGDMARASAKGRTGVYEGEGATMTLNTFASGEVEVKLRKGHLPYQILSARTPAEVPAMPGFFDVHTTQPAADAWIVSVLAMAPTGGDAQAMPRRTTLVDVAGWTGVRISRGSETDLVLFRDPSKDAAPPVDGWTTDAEAFMAGGSERVRFGAQRVKVVQRQGRTLFSSDTPTDAAYEVTESGIVVDLRATGTTTMGLSMTARPARVMVGGRELASNAWRFERGMLTFQLTAGEHHISIDSGGAR